MPLSIDDDRVAAAAARLREGGWRFSQRQLYYSACADAELAPPRFAAGEVGLGVLLILVGLIVSQHVVLIVLGGLGLVLVVTGAVTHVQERRPPSTARTLALSFADFERRFLAGARGWDGLIAATEQPGGSEPSPATVPLVVCDRVETAAVLVANLAHLGEVAVVARGHEPDEVRGLRLVVLHDCDPAGCGLVAELSDRGADVVDAGIVPGELAGRRLQIVEGAPARMPRDLSAHLDPTEIDWLSSGRRLECATETPEQLVQRVRAAL
jgi:hypothetical protein